MMESGTALRLAIEIVHVPSQVRLVRSGPLPDGVSLLLRIAAGDAEAEQAAALSTERPRELVRKAAAFFIEQILLSADADSYRILGVHPNAPDTELRRNMALLLKWLHPDLNRAGVRAVLARRVTTAWEAVKTPQRRAAYDNARSLAARQMARSATARRHNGSTRHKNGRKSLLRRGLAMLLGRGLR
jgi:DnaJ domain